MFAYYFYSPLFFASLKYVSNYKRIILFKFEAYAKADNIMSSVSAVCANITTLSLHTLCIKANEIIPMAFFARILVNQLGISE